MARTRGLSNVVHPDVAGISLGRSSQPIRGDASCKREHKRNGGEGCSPFPHLTPSCSRLERSLS